MTRSRRDKFCRHHVSVRGRQNSTRVERRPSRDKHGVTSCTTELFKERDSGDGCNGTEWLTKDSPTSPRTDRRENPYFWNVLPPLRCLGGRREVEVEHQLGAGADMIP